MIAITIAYYSKVSRPDLGPGGVVAFVAVDLVVTVVEVVDDVVVVVVVELLPDPNNQPTRRPFSGPSRMCRPVHNVLLFSTSYTRDRRSMTNSVSSSPVTVVFLAVGASLTAITSMSMSDATQLALLSHMKNENVSGPW